MNRLEFLKLLEKELSGLPKDDINKTIDYYNEIISDMIDDGMSEESAIESLGSVEEIVNVTLSEIPMKKLIKEKLGLNRRIKTWEIVLLAATFYIWLPLLIVFLALIFVGYVVLWSGVIALAAGSITAAGTSLITIGGILDIFTGNVGSGLTLIGFGVAAAGLSILLGVLTKELAKIMIIVCKKLILKIKSLFMKRGKNYE